MSMTNEVIQLANFVAIAILELEDSGYSFTLENSAIHYIQEGIKPDPDFVRPRLDFMKLHKEQALQFFYNKTKPFDLITHLLEASNKAFESAMHAEFNGDWDLAWREHRRFARLYAAFADEFGIEPCEGIPWKVWADNYDRYKCFNFAELPESIFSSS